MTAHYQVHGDVAVITLDNPPVNGLGLSTRQAVAQGLDRAIDDPAVRAIVVTGAGKAFSGGADIKEFGSPNASSSPPPMHTLWMAATTGLGESSNAPMRLSRFGSW